MRTVVECKKMMAEHLVKGLEPIREKRAYYEAKTHLVDDIIEDGCNKARKVAQATMEEVRSAIKMS